MLLVFCFLYGRPYYFLCLHLHSRPLLRFFFIFARTRLFLDSLGELSISNVLAFLKELKRLAQKLDLKILKCFFYLDKFLISKYFCNRSIGICHLLLDKLS